MLKSKLTRNIILVNIIALIILAIGFLFLSNYKTYLKKSEYKGLVSYSSLIESKVLNAKTVKKIPIKQTFTKYSLEFGYTKSDYTKNIETTREESFSFALSPYIVKKLLTHIYTPDMEIRIYDKYGNIVAKNQSNSMINSDEKNSELLSILNGSKKEIKTELKDGNLSFIKGLYYHDKIVGALIVSGGKDYITKALRDIRTAILSMFMLSLFLNIALSFYLANKITTPLYHLSNIANVISNERSYNNEFPDYSMRKDEIGELSLSLRKMVDTLWNRLLATENFASDISHEIKNPLSSLRSAAETLLKLSDEKKRNDMAIIIRNDIIRLDKLVNEISALSKLDRELIKNEIEEIAIADLLKNIVEIKQIGNEDIIFKTKFDDILSAKILGNDVKIAQVFDNLISNALSFSKNGDTITISGKIKKNHLIISVDDEGEGIPSDSLKKIFERFHSNRPKGGDINHSGLGLAISKKIIDNMQGRIFAINRRKKGARFTVVFESFK